MSDNSAAVVVMEPKPAQAAAIQKAVQVTPANDGIAAPFSSERAFAVAQKMALTLAKSSLVPQLYRNNESNCMIAMELASRIGVSVLAAMQNLDIIQGKPSWSAKFLIATVNASGRFTPLRFKWAGEAGKDSWGCRCVAKDLASGEVCEGPWITWQMAKKEGWVSKQGSKWQSMPELMFSYRAAAFWTRLYAPEIGVGFQTTEELRDQYGSAPEVLAGDGTPLPSQLTPAGAKALEAVLGVQSDAEQVEESAEEPEAVPEPVKSGLVFSKNYTVTALRGKALEDATAEQRAAYSRYLGAILSDASKASAHKAVADHKGQVDLLIEQIAADEALGDGAGA